MIWLLLGLNICLLLIYMLTNRKGINFCEPVFLLVVSTIISALFVIMNYHNWNVLEDFSLKTVTLFFGAEIFFLIGSISAKFLFASLPKRKRKLYYNYHPIIINKNIIALSFIFVIFSGIIYFFNLLQKSGLSYTGFISYMTLIRPMLKNNEISISFISLQLLNISKILAYIFSYIYIWNLITFKEKKYVYLLVPTIYIIVSLLTSGRIYFIYYAIFVYTLFFLLIKKNVRFSLRKIIKFIIYISIFLFFFFILFAVLANMVGRNTSHSIFVQLSVYIGGPLISFNKFVNSFNFSKPDYLVEETLIGIYQVLRKIGIIDVPLTRHLPFVQFGDNWGNVYTAMRRYIHDYGIIASMIIVSCIGFIYEFFYGLISKKTYLSLHCFLYAMWIYPIPMMIIDDLFLSNLLGINTIYDLFFLLLLYRIFIKKNYVERID